MHVTPEDPGMYTWPPASAAVYCRMFTALATTSAMVTIEMIDCTVIAIFAHRDNGITSVSYTHLTLPTN